MEGNGSEKRKFPRLMVEANVEYQILDEKKRKRKLAKDISSGGICIIVFENLPVDTELSLKIFLSDINYVMEVKGRVAWKSEYSLSSEGTVRYQLGIEFVDISDLDRKRLDNYIFTLLRK